MAKLWELLKGKKTYILAFIGGLVWSLTALGWLDQESANMMFTLLGFGTAAALRNGMK